MTQPEFDSWLPGSIAGYAHEHVASGGWPEAGSLERSRAEHESLLPQGLATPGHHLWSIKRTPDRQAVGMLWVHEQKTPAQAAYIYNIEIGAEHRRKGYAEKAMLLLEDEARRMGLHTIRLHVFGHNAAARPLYEKLGYLPTNIMMAKKIG